MQFDITQSVVLLITVQLVYTVLVRVFIGGPGGETCATHPSSIGCGDSGPYKVEATSTMSRPYQQGRGRVNKVDSYEA